MRPELYPPGARSLQEQFDTTRLADRLQERTVFEELEGRPIDEIIAANPDKAAGVAEKPQSLGWFVGQVMKATGGKANPAAVNDILKAKLGL